MVGGHGRAGIDGWKAFLIVGAVVAAAYATALPNGFAFDDHELVERLPARPGLSDVGRWLTRPLLFEEASGGTLGYWRPIVVLSFGLDHYWTGGDPRGFHLVNVLLHLANAWIVLAWLRRSAGNGGTGNAPALVAACVFAAHPVTSDAVAAVAGRMDLLASTGVLAAVLVASRRADVGPGRLAAVAGLTLAACLSKEIGAVTPAVLLAADLGRAAEGENGYRPARRIPLYAASAAGVAVWAGLRLAVIGSLGIVAPIRWVDNPLVRDVAAARGWSAAALIGRYAALLLFPCRLSADYGYDSIPVARTPWDPWVAAGLAAVAAVTVAAVLAFRSGRRARAVLPGAALLVLPLIPVLPWPVVSANLLAERYLYLPSVGFAVLAAAGVYAAAGAFHPEAHRAPGPGPRRAARLPAVRWLMAVIVLALAARTAVRNRDWKDDLTLFRAAEERFPRNVKVLSNLAYEYNLQGDLDRARTLLQRAVSIAPGFTENVLNLGNVYAAQGRLGDAVEAFRRRIADREDDARAHRNLGKVLAQLGRLEESRLHLERAIAIDPAYLDARLDLASVRLRGGDWSGALDQYRLVLELAPDSGEAAFGASLASRAGGDEESARAFALRARDAGYRLPDGYLASLP